MLKKREKKFLSPKTFIVWFFVFIMTFSIGGFFLGNNTGKETAKYNGFNLYRQGNVWMTKIDGKAMPFSYLPSQLESISFDSSAADKLRGKSSVYITFDPNRNELTYLELARFEIAEDLTKFYNIYVNHGMTNESSAYQLPIVTCQNATEFFPVIYLKQINDASPDNSTDLANFTGKIYSLQNCVILEGKSNDFIMLKDRLMYSLAGVMP